jgi:ferric-dicitrate binding protein FerR (iron transport regulator)
MLKMGLRSLDGEGVCNADARFDLAQDDTSMAGKLALRTSGSLLSAVIGLAAWFPATAHGQDQPAAQDQPAQAVSQAPPPAGSQPGAHTRRPFRSARLTYVQGDVASEQANSQAKDQAALNMPVVEGTVISAGDDGQAEIEFEDGSLVRLTPNSAVSLLNLSVDSSGNYQTRIALLGGLAYFELRARTKYQYSVDAGGDVITPVENATIRVNFDEPPAVIAVLDGSAHVETAGGAGSGADANAGQTVRVEAASEGGGYLVKAAISPESWDNWNEDRDEAAASEANSQTDVRSKYAGDQGYGWSDLDANGNWYEFPGQRDVWQPDGGDQDGFDPYGYGSWVWAGGGYVWASGYGWGWLPYRCGSWNYWDGFGWGWSPAYSCGAYGFEGGGFYAINIGIVPRGYRKPGRPLPGPGRIHPIVTRGNPLPARPIHTVGTPRVFAGKTVLPIEPVGGGGYTPRGGSAVGWGLRRDYPVDRTTHEPVNGVVATHTAAAPAYGNARVPWQPAQTRQPGQRPGSASETPGRQPAYAPRPGPGGTARQAPVVRQPPAPRPAAAPPAQHSAPPASHSSPSPKGK